MKIIMLAGNGVSSKIVFNALSKQFNIEKILIEKPVPKKVFLKRRIKRIGLLSVIGQILFKLTIEPILLYLSKKRIDEIINKYKININDINQDKIIQIESVNSEEGRLFLQEIKPDIVVVNGTRIISEKTLNCINAKFINMHAGITPKYRGVHGAYWAIVNNDMDNCGVTVHFVDKGIDTGSVIYQTRIELNNKDNFVTYPFLQTAYGIEIEKKAIEDIINGDIKTFIPELESKLYYHPTFWGYLRKLIFYGIK